MGAEAPSNRLRVAQIGCGRIAQVHDVPAVLKSGLADYVAVSDLDSRRMADSKAQVESFYRQSAMPAPQVKTVSDYRELLRQPDLDAVVRLIDHRRDQLQTEAFYLGGRVYAETPKAFIRRMHRSWTAGRGQAAAERERHPGELAGATRAAPPA